MKKDKSLLIRLSEDEYFKLKKAAAASGVSMSGYLRLGIGEKREPIVIPEDFKKMLYELNHVGINLNQLVVVARTKNYPIGEIKDCLQGLDEVRSEILKRVMNS